MAAGSPPDSAGGGGHVVGVCNVATCECMAGLTVDDGAVCTYLPVDMPSYTGTAHAYATAEERKGLW